MLGQRSRVASVYGVDTPTWSGRHWEPRKKAPANLEMDVPFCGCCSRPLRSLWWSCLPWACRVGFLPSLSGRPCLPLQHPALREARVLWEQLSQYYKARSMNRVSTGLGGDHGPVAVSVSGSEVVVGA